MKMELIHAFLALQISVRKKARQKLINSARKRNLSHFLYLIWSVPLASQRRFYFPLLGIQRIVEGMLTVSFTTSQAYFRQGICSSKARWRTQSIWYHLPFCILPTQRGDLCQSSQPYIICSQCRRKLHQCPQQLDAWVPLLQTLPCRMLGLQSSSGGPAERG